MKKQTKQQKIQRITENAEIIVAQLNLMNAANLSDSEIERCFAGHELESRYTPIAKMYRDHQIIKTE